MGAPLSQDLRQRFVRAWKSGRATTRELAAQFGIGEATAGRWKRLYRETDSVEPRQHGGGQKRRIGKKEEKTLQKLVVKHPDWTEAEFTAELRAKFGLKVSAVTVGRAIRRLGYSVKKRPSWPASVTDQKFNSDAETILPQSRRRPLHVWFLWTKRARTSR